MQYVHWGGGHKVLFPQIINHFYLDIFTAPTILFLYLEVMSMVDVEIALLAFGYFRAYVALFDATAHSACDLPAIKSLIRICRTAPIFISTAFLKFPAIHNLHLVSIQSYMFTE